MDDESVVAGQVPGVDQHLIIGSGCSGRVGLERMRWTGQSAGEEAGGLGSLDNAEDHRLREKEEHSLPWTWRMGISGLIFRVWMKNRTEGSSMAMICWMNIAGLMQAHGTIANDGKSPSAGTGPAEF